MDMDDDNPPPPPATPNNAAPPQQRRASMTEDEQKERRASIRAIMKDSTLTRTERRKSIQALMDGLPAPPPTPENLPPDHARCADGALCEMIASNLPHAGFAHKRHRCPDCQGHLHTLCGVEDELLVAAGSMHTRRCLSCHEQHGVASGGDDGDRDPPGINGDVNMVDCESSIRREAGQARPLPPRPNNSRREVTNSETTNRRNATYVPTESCEKGEDYCPPRTLLAALEASPAPEHPELIARRATAMFALHWDQVRAVHLEAERKREADQRRDEQQRIEWEESNYPSKQFKLFSSNPSDNEYGLLRLKGRVSNLKPGRQLARVEACAIGWTVPNEEALLVIRRPAAPGEQEYVMAICKEKMLPSPTTMKLHSLSYNNERRKYGIQRVSGEYRAEPVAPGNQDEPRYRIANNSPLFGGKICCQDMLNALQSGSVGQKVQTITHRIWSKRNKSASDGKPKKKKLIREYVILPHPFASGSLGNGDSMRRISADPNDGTMSLLATSQEDRNKMLKCAECARDSLFSEPRRLLKTIEELNALDDRNSTKNPPLYFVFLNVALGGGETLPPFGRFY